MKVLIFGATGSTGKYLLEKAILLDHEITVFVRNPSKINFRSPNLKIVQGDATQFEDVQEVVPLNDIIISVLGTPLGQKTNLC